MSSVTITDVRTILTAPEGVNLVVVRIDTNVPGLYGFGCATFTQRYLAVATAVEEYLKPFLIGKDATRIEDIWNTACVSAYWRNGPIMNNALSGVDMALWDIAGKLAGMPLHQMLGGKVREGVPVYVHADGRSVEEVAEAVAGHLEAGYKHVRCQMGTYGGEMDDRATRSQRIDRPAGAPPGQYYDPKQYVRSVYRLFDHLTEVFGQESSFLHDVHERLSPIEAVAMAKEMQKYPLLYLEDLLAPENIGWFPLVRQHSAVPLAMGELFNNPQEWIGLVSGRLIDFIRIHVSQIGGITPARKLTALCETFGVRTAWHGPRDLTPIGHSANVHLSSVCVNFGVQEWNPFFDATHEVFQGCPQVKDGYIYPSDKPGLGIEVDEQAAKRFPCDNALPAWTLARLPDGTPARP